MHLVGPRSLAVFLSLIGFSHSLHAQFLNEAPIRDVPQPQPATRVQRDAVAQAATGFSVNTSHREESRIFFHSVYLASEDVPIGWTGNTAQGLAGTTSQAFRDAVALRVNYFRAMGGVPAAITLSATYNGKDQKAALMMSANNELNHNPPATWTFYTAAGAEAAANSNLYLGHFGPDAIDGYMEDPGSINEAAGHRRWVLYPQTTTMGTGDLPASGAYLPANALWVVDANAGGARPATRESFVAWPPSGYVPFSLVFPRWSFSYPDADFTNCFVSMVRNGTQIPVSVHAPHTGYGENTVVWEPITPDPTDPPAQDVSTTVTVSNVIIAKVARSFTYTVTEFNPALPGSDTVEPVVTGTTAPYVGVAYTCAFNTVPRATGYQWQQSTLAAQTDVEGAENGLGGVTVKVPAGYNVVTTAVHAGGAKSFQFTHPDFTTQSITLNTPVVPRNASNVTFKSRLGWATSSQIARVQVSTDDGASWQNAWSQPGDGASGETSFKTRSVSLAAYTGRIARIRFLYDYDFGQPVYTQTNAGVGWYVDDIAFTDTDKRTGSTTSAIQQDANFVFTPGAAGAYGLRARPVYFQTYPGEWGPLLRAAATPPPGDFPNITEQPHDVSATVGTSATLSVKASANGPLTYQWRKNGKKIGGATATMLTIDAVTTANAGIYTVVITRGVNSVTSTEATLTITTPLSNGTYRGLAVTSPPKHGTTGLVKIDVTTARSFTGQITFGGKPIAIVGNFDANGVAQFDTGTTKTITRPSPQPPLQLKLKLDFVAWRITGTISATGVFSSAISTDRKLFTANANPVAPKVNVPPVLLGAYRATISVNPAASGLPTGTGNVTLIVQANGNVNAAGTLPDGSKFTYGNYLSTNLDWPFYLARYAGRGSIAGVLQFDENNGGGILGVLTWFRPAISSSLNYPNGWPSGCTVDFVGIR